MSAEPFWQQMADKWEEVSVWIGVIGKDAHRESMVVLSGSRKQGGFVTWAAVDRGFVTKSIAHPWKWAALRWFVTEEQEPEDGELVNGG